MSLVLPDGPGPIFASHGHAAVSYAPGHDICEVEFAVGGTRTACSAADALDLVDALLEALGAQGAQAPGRRGSRNGTAAGLSTVPTVPKETSVGHR